MKLLTKEIKPKLVPVIGDDVLHENKIVHVQDRNCLSQTAKVGVKDGDGMVWETEWVEWEKLKKVSVG